LGTRHPLESYVSRSPAVIVTGVSRQGRWARRSRSMTGLPTPLRVHDQVDRTALQVGARNQTGHPLHHGGIVDPDRNPLQIPERAALLRQPLVGHEAAADADLAPLQDRDRGMVAQLPRSRPTKKSVLTTRGGSIELAAPGHSWTSTKQRLEPASRSGRGRP
jgi:hypothetical protein